MSHRSWFPSILIGLSLALAVLIAAAYKPEPASDVSVNNDEPAMTAPSADEYEAGVRAVLASYASTSDASAAYDALVAMRVPSLDYQSAHLELVIAFAQMKAGNSDEGQARLDLATTAYPWLAP